MLKTKTRIAVLSMLVLTALLCLTACTPWQVHIGQYSDVVTNNTPKVRDEQEQANTETSSYDKQKETVKHEIEPKDEPDTKIFFGEEYVRRNDIEVPKYVLKNIPTGQVKKQEYKLVTPTQEEFDEIDERLNPILSMFFSDYDCEKDNIYDLLISYNHLDYAYPIYNDEVAEYIAKPLGINTENDFWFWDITGIYKDDPLKIFPIFKEVYDDNGNIDLDKAYELSTGGKMVTIGHNMFSGAYIDWLVEGVWNGKADHETFFEFEDGTLLYYYDGNYYAPKYEGGRGGGIMYGPYIQEITPLGDNKYKMVYYKNDGGDLTDKPLYNKWYETVIGLKETQDGFRFWSIFEFKYTGAEWSDKE